MKESDTSFQNTIQEIERTAEILTKHEFNFIEAEDIEYIINELNTSNN